MDENAEANLHSHMLPYHIPTLQLRVLQISISSVFEIKVLILLSLRSTRSRSPNVSCKWNSILSPSEHLFTRFKWTRFSEGLKTLQASWSHGLSTTEEWFPLLHLFKACFPVSSLPQIFGMIFSMMLCCAIKKSRDFVWITTQMQTNTVLNWPLLWKFILF